MTNAEPHFFCMDVLHIESAAASQPLTDGVLLEIWPSGGVIQADEPLQAGEKFTVAFEGGQVEAEVESYQQDAFGYYIQFAVSKPWFPDVYQPYYLKAPIQTHLAHAS
jgi:hypothetical protein